VSSRIHRGRRHSCVSRCMDRKGPARVTPAVLLVGVLSSIVLVSLVLAGCSDRATDTNEPNDDLNVATKLAPGTPTDGVIGSDDFDVFRCDAPKGEALHRFLVTVRTEDPQDIELQVGASIPGVWEGITWPGWQAITKGDRIELAGSLQKGTVLMFLKGVRGTAYSIDITWE